METEERVQNEEVPTGQTLFDNIFLWLALGLLVPGVLYTVWGLIELFRSTPVP